MAGLAKVLGLPSLTFYGTGLILGAGIYSILGAAAGEAGPGLWLSFVLAAAIAGLTGLSYAELVAMFPSAGAEYQYVRAAWPEHRAAAATAGLVLTASATATAATVSIAFGGYLRIFFDVPVLVSALALMAAVAGLNILGIRQSAWANIVMTSLVIGGLLLVVWVGATGPGLGEGAGAAPLLPVAAGAGLVFFAFLGFEDIANLAEEARHPRRDAPRAIFLSLAIAATLYAAVAMAAVALLPPGDLAASDSPLSDAVAAESALAARIVAAVALFATATTALISLLAASRLVFAVSRGGDAPRVFAQLLPHRDTPWIATLLVTVAGMGLLPLGDVALLGSLASLFALAAFIAVDACVVRLRFTAPDRDRPFCIAGAWGRLPVLPIIGAIGAFAFALQFDARTYVVGAIVAVLIAAVVALGRRGDRRQRETTLPP